MNYQGLANEEPFEEGKASSIESAASNDSDLIALNPDGSLMRATPAPKYNIKLEEEQHLNAAAPNNQIVYIVDNDEIIFYADANEIPAYFDDFVGLFLKHQHNFRYFLLLAIVSETIFQILGYIYRDRKLIELQLLYPRASEESLSKILITILCIDTAFVVLYYTLGIIATLKKSTKLLGYFTTFSMVGLLLEMLLAYVENFNFYIFLLRFIGMIYSRFLNQILISLLLIPRVTNQNPGA